VVRLDNFFAAFLLAFCDCGQSQSKVGFVPFLDLTRNDCSIALDGLEVDAFEQSSLELSPSLLPCVENEFRLSAK
jgi:hypothetical protein